MSTSLHPSAQATPFGGGETGMLGEAHHVRARPPSLV
jgi:hypothetical protein